MPNETTTPEQTAAAPEQTTPAPDPAVKKPAPTGVTNNAPPSPEAQPEPGTGGSQFLPQSTEDTIKAGFGLKSIDPHMQEMLKDAKAQKMAKGVMITMPDGQKIYAGKSGNDQDFIGPADATKPFTEKTAEVIIGLSMAKGWKDIHVGGNQQEKDLLWIEAQRHGLNVANYKPEKDSEIVKKWEDEKLHGRKPEAGVSEAPVADQLQATVKLIKAKAEASDDPALKAGLNSMADKLAKGNLHVDEKLAKGVAGLLGDKPDVAAFNKVADGLNKMDPTLKIATLGAPAEAAPAAGQGTRAIRRTNAAAAP